MGANHGVGQGAVAGNLDRTLSPDGRRGDKGFAGRLRGA
ncbi:hypothetical protein CCNA_03329 [Caulobacter vibrioides NA1000]|uniref:Uncharacterized protein n=1 Tax=Caulobacter vibrioides (strain NA1000 / CB15N) TaxID=565050 RepID=A0A0H3CEL3_CAUVN|nr:hypothetical protein [Caulobacter vibrioides]YP_002518701.1 hypothetical protein CCNA_03329 [Caulobacter vibrioides NA1000]ACL96793.1 hypothetical protein CCNA_03329 [Caulobacter vibrioides NA1000]